MDAAAVAQQSATSVDPTAIQKLKGHGDDPAARRAVAAQFASFLTQGLMRNADGSALPMAEGVGADTVSSLFANVMSQVASSSPQLGLADVLLNAMPGKGGTPDAAAATNGVATASVPGSAGSAASAASAPSAAAMPGLSLLPYRSGIRAFVGSARPLPPSIAPSIAPKAAAGIPTTPTPGSVASPATAPTVSGGVPAAPVPANSGPAPTPATNASGSRQTSNADARARFVEKLEPSLRDAARQLGVSPRVLLAQAALETGWGSSMPGNNIFGVKAGPNWTGNTISASTVEETTSGPARQTDRFRAYPSVEAAVADYAKLIAGDSRYARALGAGDNAAAYGAALGRAGYATDPAYATKMAAVASSASMSAALDGAPATTLYADRGSRGSHA